jgi:hypothetical protein
MWHRLVEQLETIDRWPYETNCHSCGPARRGQTAGIRNDEIGPATGASTRTGAG